MTLKLVLIAKGITLMNINSKGLWIGITALCKDPTRRNVNTKSFI